MVTIWTILLIIGLTVAGLLFILYAICAILGVFRDSRGITETICGILLLILVIYVIVGYLMQLAS